jgi:hypothetical protein
MGQSCFRNSASGSHFGGVAAGARGARGAGLAAGGFGRGGFVVTRAGFFGGAGGLLAAFGGGGLAFAAAGFGGSGGGGAGLAIAGAGGGAGSATAGGGGGSAGGGSAGAGSMAGGSTGTGSTASGGGLGSATEAEGGAGTDPAGGEFPTVRGGSFGLRSSSESSTTRCVRGLTGSSAGAAAGATPSAAEGRSNAPAASATASAPPATPAAISHFPRSDRRRCSAGAFDGGRADAAGSSGAGSGLTIAVTSGEPFGLVVPGMRTGIAGSLERAARAAGETSALAMLGTGAGVDGMFGRRGSAIFGGDGRAGGGGKDRFVPATIGFVAGSDAARSSGLGSAGGFVAGFAGFVGIAAFAGFGAGSLVADADAPGPSVRLGFTSCVGPVASLTVISCPSHPRGSRPGSSGSRDRAR